MPQQQPPVGRSSSGRHPSYPLPAEHPAQASSQLSTKTVLEFMLALREILEHAKDAISDVDVDLEKQSIYLYTDGAKRINAKELADLLSEKTRHFLVLAKAGSGKSWMMQQLALALATLFLEKKQDKIPLLIPVQRLVGVVGQDSILQALNQPAQEAMEFLVGRFLKARGTIIPGVVLNNDTHSILMDMLGSKRLILLIDGVDEASSCSGAVELLARRWAFLGVTIVVTSRPEGIAQRHQGVVVPKQLLNPLRFFFSKKSDVDLDNGESERNVPESRIINLSGKGIVVSGGNGVFKVRYDNGEVEDNVAGQRITNLSSRGKISKNVQSWHTTFTVMYDDGVTEKEIWRDRVTPDSGRYTLAEHDQVQVRDRPLSVGNKVQVQKPATVGDLVEVTYEEGGRFSVEEGWDLLGLPELTLKQQKQLVDAVQARTISRGGGLDFFFDNLFRFSESRNAYDRMFQDLGQNDMDWFATKSLPKTVPCLQMARDGMDVDQNLLRRTLESMWEVVQKDIHERVKHGNLVKKEAQKQLQEENAWLRSSSNFHQQFHDKGMRLFELFAIAELAKELFDSIMDDARKESFEAENQTFQDNPEFVQTCPCDLKGLPRTLEKAIQDYSKRNDKFGGLRKVIDIVRGSIICKTVDGFKSVVRALENDPRVRIRRFKNLFRDLDPSHFRRFSYNIEIKVSVDGVDIPHIAELQIHLGPFYKFKREREDLCHRPYEYFREGGKKEVVMPKLQKQMDTMHEIAQTPVLLSLFCTTVDATGRRPDLPTSLYELYETALSKRLHGNEALRSQLQKIAFDNFVHGNRREFTLDDMKHSNSTENINIDLEKKVPLLKAALHH